MEEPANETTQNSLLELSESVHELFFDILSKSIHLEEIRKSITDELKREASSIERKMDNICTDMSRLLPETKKIVANTKNISNAANSLITQLKSIRQTTEGNHSATEKLSEELKKAIQQIESTQVSIRTEFQDIQNRTAKVIENLENFQGTLSGCQSEIGVIKEGAGTVLTIGREINGELKKASDGIASLDNQRFEEIKKYQRYVRQLFWMQVAVGSLFLLSIISEIVL